MTVMELTDEQRSIVGKVEKLLKLAAKNPNQHEAASAAAKAQQMLAEHNLSMTIVDQSGGAAKRTDEKIAGGLYKYQRSLWKSVAELNFCLYFSLYVFDPDKTGRSKNRYGEVRKRKGGYRFEHRLVGRVHNVASTKVMAEYLEQAIDRVTRERVNGMDSTQYFSKWAVSFREGCAEEIEHKIYQRRREMLSTERQKEHEAKEAAAKAGMAMASTATSLVLASLTKSEKDANNDFLYGEGFTAKQATEQAAWAAEMKEREEAHARWAAANPEEAAQREEERRKESRRYGHTPWNYGMAQPKGDRGAYKAGREAGAKIGIDPQTSGGSHKRLT